jgi:hypothetical protein
MTIGFMSPFVISIVIVDDLEMACCPLKRRFRPQAVGTETAKALRTLSWMPQESGSIENPYLCGLGSQLVMCVTAL